MNLIDTTTGLRFAGPAPRADFEGLPGVSEVVDTDGTLRMRVSGSITPIVRAASRFELLDFVSREPTLEETFLAEYGPQAAVAGASGAASAGRVAADDR